jgi:hypothetical protein
VPIQAKKYTLLWIPRSGLFFETGNFFDGKGERIRWDRTVHIFASHARAETAKKRVLEKSPDAKGELIVLPVEIQEIGGTDHEVSGQFDGAFSEEN